jgi:OFA family oxalate/formate antiporter-like MFS transporter
MVIGVVMLILATFSGSFMRNPPAGYVPAGYNPPVCATSQAANDALTAKDCLCSRNFIVFWLIFFANICAGIMFIGMQSPMLQDLLRGKNPEETTAALAAAGATLIAISSLFNGVGRMFWGGISDRIGRVPTFRLLLGSQILIFVALMFIKSPIIFCVLVCYVLLCYGGGFGTAPSTVLTIFGARLMPTVYGVALTAWSMGGIVGPQVAAMIKDKFPNNAPMYTFSTGAVILLTGLLLSFMLSDKPFKKKA